MLPGTALVCEAVSSLPSMGAQDARPSRAHKPLLALAAVARRRPSRHSLPVCAGVGVWVDSVWLWQATLLFFPPASSLSAIGAVWGQPARPWASAASGARGSEACGRRGPAAPHANLYKLLFLLCRPGVKGPDSPSRETTLWWSPPSFLPLKGWLGGNAPQKLSRRKYVVFPQRQRWRV